MLEDRSVRIKLLVALGLGGFLETYYIYLVTYLLPFFSTFFFPKGLSLFWAYLLLYLAWFLIQPLSSFYFGHYGDKYGRKRMLIISLVIMAVSVFLIGIFPSYDTIGVWAFIFFVLLVWLQGFSFGGEFGSATTFLAEYAPKEKRGFYVSWIYFSTFLGIFFSFAASGFVYDLKSWSWRYPFLIGLILTVIGIYLRAKIPETPVFQRMANENRVSSAPVSHMFRNYWKTLLLTIGITIGIAVILGFQFEFLEYFFIHVVRIDRDHALFLNSCTSLIIILFIPFAGAISDKVGRKYALFWGYTAIAVISFPLFLLVAKAHPAFTMIVLFFFGLFGACVLGLLGLYIAEQFPTSVRFTGFCFALNIGLGIFETIISLMTEYEVTFLPNTYSAALFVTGGCLIALLCLRGTKETAFTPLKEGIDRNPL